MWRCAISRRHLRTGRPSVPPRLLAHLLRFCSLSFYSTEVFPYLTANELAGEKRNYPPTWPPHAVNLYYSFVVVVVQFYLFIEGFSFIKWNYRVIRQPKRYSRADVSSFSPSSGRDSVSIKTNKQKQKKNAQRYSPNEKPIGVSFLYHHSFIQSASLSLMPMVWTGE